MSSWTHYVWKCDFIDHGETKIEKDGGKVFPHQFECAPFFFFHTINAFERHNDTIVVDIMAYKNADVSAQYVKHNLNIINNLPFDLSLSRTE